jgi:hypothetical protein
MDFDDLEAGAGGPIGLKGVLGHPEKVHCWCAWRAYVRFSRLACTPLAAHPTKRIQHAIYTCYEAVVMEYRLIASGSGAARHCGH